MLSHSSLSSFPCSSFFSLCFSLDSFYCPAAVSSPFFFSAVSNLLLGTSSEYFISFTVFFTSIWLPSCSLETSHLLVYFAHSFFKSLNILVTVINAYVYGAFHFVFPFCSPIFLVSGNVLLYVGHCGCHMSQTFKYGLRFVLRLILTPSGTDFGFVRMGWESRHYSRAGVAPFSTCGLSGFLA